MIEAGRGAFSKGRRSPSSEFWSSCVWSCGSRVVRPRRVAHENHLVPRVAQQREEALALDVEAVRRAADLGRPEQPELARRVLVRRDAARVLEVACGQYHTLAIVFHSHHGGKVYSWGT